MLPVQLKMRAAKLSSGSQFNHTPACCELHCHLLVFVLCATAHACFVLKASMLVIAPSISWFMILVCVGKSLRIVIFCLPSRLAIHSDSRLVNTIFCLVLRFEITYITYLAFQV